MKKRSSFIGLAFLTAILMLSVGYAAINSTLNVTGTANVTASNDNFKVKFDGSIPIEKNKAEATVSGDLAATITVNDLKKTGDVATAVYTIKNVSPELVADLKVGIIENNNTNYFKVTAEIANLSINANDSTTLTVTVQLVKTPVDNQTATIKVPVEATARVS